MRQPISRLCQRLGYTFTNESYLIQALTHCSAGEKNYERLEFLGDSILNMVISCALFSRYPQQSEGQLSRLRACLVKGDTLADIALEIDLGNYLYLGQGELKSGGFRRRSILADALEAVFAALFLDGTLFEAERVILELFNDRLLNDALDANLKDAKTQLQEYLQAQKLPLPIYKVEHVIGDEHEQVFHITCELPKLNKTSIGYGETRRKAEQEAAIFMLQQLKEP